MVLFPWCHMGHTHSLCRPLNQTEIVAPTFPMTITARWSRPLIPCNYFVIINSLLDKQWQFCCSWCFRAQYSHFPAFSHRVTSSSSSSAPCLQSATACPFPLYGDKQFVYSEGHKVNHSRRVGKIWSHVAIFTSHPCKLGMINTHMRACVCVCVCLAGVLCHHPPSIKSNRQMTGRTKTNLLLRRRINDQWQVFVVLACVCVWAFMRKRQECVGCVVWFLHTVFVCFEGEMEGDEKERDAGGMKVA